MSKFWDMKIMQRLRVNTQDTVFRESSWAWTGPLSDLNLQPVCWHAYNTCSYAWLRHIRLWNSTSSAGPLTICHFLRYFPSCSSFYFLFLQPGGCAAKDTAHSELFHVSLVTFFMKLSAGCHYLNTVWKKITTCNSKYSSGPCSLFYLE